MGKMWKGFLSESDKIRLEVYGPELFARIKREEELEEHRLSRGILEEQGKRKTLKRRFNPLMALDGRGEVVNEFDNIRECAACYGIGYSKLAIFVRSHRPYAAYRAEAGVWLQYRHDWEQGYGREESKRGR